MRSVVVAVGGESPLAVFAVGSGIAGSAPAGVVAASPEGAAVVASPTDEVDEPDDVPAAPVPAVTVIVWSPPVGLAAIGVLPVEAAVTIG
jgi:hypothetical protein